MAPALRPLAAPAAILAAATLAAALAPPLPPSLAGLSTLGPYAMLAGACLVCVWFNRGRAFVLAFSILAAWAGWEVAQAWGAGSAPAKAAYAALVVLVPGNALAAYLLPERGVRYHGSGRWLALFALEALLVLWVAASGRSLVSGTAWQAMLDHWLLRGPPVPLAGRILTGAAFALAAWRCWPDARPVDVASAAAILLFYIGCTFAASPATAAIFVSAAGAAIVVGVLQESHRLAFRDALTGLPNRRALEEDLRALGPAYTIAMVDVDHFKKFNDTHGHDIGDQVLRLVGSRLAGIGGGGRAYRYGGEEFAVLFPGRTLEEALPHLEAIRAEIERYRMAVRGEDRPKDEKEGSRLRGARAPEKVLSVTVSIGAADASAGRKPERVLKAADEALYRAKQSGRNRVSA
ncbi:MAG: GGDEF domain-containing protein [Burkholderiales bacterium]|nr:GGDEF domain-containing protein [Burkholderiales bacterium]